MSPNILSKTNVSLSNIDSKSDYYLQISDMSPNILSKSELVCMIKTQNQTSISKSDSVSSKGSKFSPNQTLDCTI